STTHSIRSLSLLFYRPVLHLSLHSFPTRRSSDLVDLAADLLERQHVSLAVFRPTVERAELAVRHAHIRVVDVPVDDVRDDVLRVEAPARLISQAAQLEQRRALVQLQK